MPVARRPMLFGGLVVAMAPALGLPPAKTPRLAVLDPSLRPAAELVAQELGWRLAEPGAFVLGVMEQLAEAARRREIRLGLSEPGGLEPEWRGQGMIAGDRFAWPLGVSGGPGGCRVVGIACAADTPPCSDAALHPLLALDDSGRLAAGVGWYPVRRPAWDGLNLALAQA